MGRQCGSSTPGKLFLYLFIRYLFPVQDRVQRTIDNVMTNFDVEQCFAFAGLVQTRWRPFLEDYYLKTKDST